MLTLRVRLETRWSVGKHNLDIGRCVGVGESSRTKVTCSRLSLGQCRVLTCRQLGRLVNQRIGPDIGRYNSVRHLGTRLGQIVPGSLYGW